MAYTMEELKNGRFENVSLNCWFSKYYFKYIFAVIEGCKKNPNSDILKFICIYAQYLIDNPNADQYTEEELRKIIRNSEDCPRSVYFGGLTYRELVDYWNCKIVSICESILVNLIRAMVGNEVFYKNLIEELYTSKNDLVRLHCCANFDYTRFLNDSCPRVAKVAQIRTNYSLDNYSTEDSQRIRFLKAAIETDAISCGPIEHIYQGEDKIYAKISSLLFQEDIDLDVFDIDIYSTISDKSVLAAVLNELIKRRVIMFREGFSLDLFSETSYSQLR